MPAKSERQRKAAGADLQRIREGKRPRTFKGASEEQIRDFARKPRQPSRRRK